VSSLIGRNLGQYEILEMLGKGGMATVYLGRQASIDRLVAIKVLPPHPALDEAFRERFQLEAKTIGSLQNPNILPLYDYGSFEDVLYLVMAYVEGGTLEDLMDGGPMNADLVEKILRSVASALDYAHRKGVIHRDVKPANILIHDGHPLLADFGMVKMTVGDNNLTGTAIVGTPSYMAPEQGQGLKVDKRVDVYALGAVVYEMLTGQQPFIGTTPMQMILSHISDPVPDIRKLRKDLPAEMSAIFQIVLAKDPKDRYQSAGEFAEAFSKVLHKNSETLANIQKQFPIRTTVETKAVEPTVNFKREQSEQQPTQVIVRDSVNPIILMGGFGLIALVIVIVAVLLINNSNNNTSLPDTTEAVIENTSAATNVPLVLPTSAPSFGEVRFSSENNLGDRVEVRLSGVRPADNYVAWLVNTETSEAIALGRVVVDAVGEGTATYSDTEGRMLSAYYNAVLVSQEADLGEAPSGEIIYSAVLPLSVTRGLNQIFVASENGLNGGSLINGVSIEADFAIQHAGLAANATNIGGLRTHSEHTINILRGEQADYTGDGSGQNPGRGVGVYFFLDTIDAILLEAVNEPNATVDLQANAEYIRICTQNVRIWADDVIALETTMLAGESPEAVANEANQSTLIAQQMQTGFDQNANGIIEPFEGECGLDQIADYGLQFARMEMREGDTRIALGE
jgi:serine/threonine protein kinase